MLISDFDFTLPAGLIAQEPLPQRDASRMLSVDRTANSWRDEAFTALPAYLQAGDILALNNTRVFPARLAGVREPSGGRVELFLVQELEPLIWETLARPGRRLQPGQQIVFAGGKLHAQVLEARADGRRVVRFACDTPFEQVLDELGRTPLPPYIKREGTENLHADRERYQTVYARERGAIAAPTAGLHFTPDVLADIRSRGAQVVEITLHVGYGTFAPVRAREVAQHQVAAERYSIKPEAASAINAARANGGRLFVVGTTTTRALESAADGAGQVQHGDGWAGLTIKPGYQFRVVDALLTNFHLPQSSLLLLVSAFAGYELALAAYRHAVSERYRFYSYGDCMLLR